MSPERQWWLRVPAVFLSPRAVFVALREEGQDDVEARQEPVLLLVFLAGIAAALATPTARTLYDDSEYDGALVAVWAFIAGGLTAVVGYFIIGGALYLGARTRQPRQLQALAAPARIRPRAARALAPPALA